MPRAREVTAAGAGYLPLIIPPIPSLVNPGGSLLKHVTLGLAPSGSGSGVAGQNRTTRPRRAK
eukprot:5464911-Alexandrium_andersonii.AAC.1